jgi:hypothetical protein
MKNLVAFWVALLVAILMLPTILVGFLYTFLVGGFSLGREIAASLAGWVDPS